MSSTSLASTYDKSYDKSVYDENMSVVSNYTSGTATVAKAANVYNDERDNLKKIWHQVLRECHRADPERNGQVSRNIFIAALQKSDTGKVFILHFNK